MVLRALIVEDERVTRETLRTLVPWARLGVDEVDTARDGVDALDKADRCMPDLVISDIRMPRMGGIELAQRLRERSAECRIIFLSGHSDKEYLKAAIRLHAADYIDKPLNLEEIGAAVERNVRAARARAGATAEAERARRVLDDLGPVLRAELAEALCRPGSDVAALRTRHAAEVGAAFFDGPLRVAVAGVELPGGDPPPEARVREIVRSVNEAAAPGAPSAWFAAPDRLALLAAGEPVRDDAQFEALLAAVAARVERACAARLRFGLGPVARDAAASLAGALAALEMQFYDPGGPFLRSPAEGSGPAAPLDEGLADQLRGALPAGDLAGAAVALRALEARARDGRLARPAAVREAYGRVLALVVDLAPGWDPAEVRVEQERIRHAVSAQPTLGALAALAEATLRRCYAAATGSAGERRIARIKEYIRAHHADPDLLVETIAAAAGLSESYLCTLFKQACGITVKDFVTALRIDRAKQLLRSTADKLQAVAVQAGFRDANNFSTVFKREAGVTPSEYRERSRQ